MPVYNRYNRQPFMILKSKNFNFKLDLTSLVLCSLTVINKFIRSMTTDNSSYTERVGALTKVKYAACVVIYCYVCVICTRTHKKLHR